MISLGFSVQAEPAHQNQERLPEKKYWVKERNTITYTAGVICSVSIQKMAAMDCHINNFTTLSAVGVLQYSFLPLALYQILKSGNYLTIYTQFPGQTKILVLTIT